MRTDIPKFIIKSNEDFDKRLSDIKKSLLGAFAEATKSYNLPKFIVSKEQFDLLQTIDTKFPGLFGRHWDFGYCKRNRTTLGTYFLVYGIEVEIDETLQNEFILRDKDGDRKFIWDMTEQKLDHIKELYDELLEEAYKVYHDKYGYLIELRTKEKNEEKKLKRTNKSYDKDVLIKREETPGCPYKEGDRIGTYQILDKKLVLYGYGIFLGKKKEKVIKRGVPRDIEIEVDRDYLDSFMLDDGREFTIQEYQIACAPEEALKKFIEESDIEVKINDNMPPARFIRELKEEIEMLISASDQSKTKEEKKMRIYLDIDGILADWLGECCKICEIDPKNPEIRNKLKEGIFLDELGVVNADEMWKRINAIGANWWANLPLLPWAEKVHHMLRELGDVCLLTSPGRKPGVAKFAAYGKVEWMDKYFPDTPWIITHKKFMLAREDSFLVDDTQKKVFEFKEYGGDGFVWPNQYLFEDGEKDVDEVLEELKDKILEYDPAHFRHGRKVISREQIREMECPFMPYPSDNFSINDY